MLYPNTARPSVLLALGAALALSATASALPQWSTNPALNQVVSDAASNQDKPKIAAASDGGYWVSWFDGAATGWDVRLQRYNADGVAARPKRA